MVNAPVMNTLMMIMMMSMLMMSNLMMNMNMRAYAHARGSAGNRNGEPHFHAAASD